jgi:nucleoside 2-deoxyribosyltransferase
VKIYLAGPDVFRPDALAWAAEARATCRRHGFEPLTPLDPPAESAADRIYQANLGLIGQAQAVVANLNPFRGAEPDSGTCFEVGYAIALGKPVWGYLDSLESLRDRVNRLEGAHRGREFDNQGMTIEHFDLPLNLMLAIPARIVAGDMDACLRSLHLHLHTTGTNPTS